MPVKHRRVKADSSIARPEHDQTYYQKKADGMSKNCNSNSHERAKRARRLGKVAHAKSRGDREREPRLLACCLGYGCAVSGRSHSGCPSLRPEEGRRCSPCLQQRLLHRRQLRKPRISRWPSYPSRDPGNARCKKGSPRGPQSPSPPCKWGTCASWRASFLLRELCVWRLPRPCRGALRVERFYTEVTEAKVTLSSKEEYSSGQDAEGCPSGDAMKLFGGRDVWDGHSDRAISRSGPRQNFDDAADQVVGVRLGNFHASGIPGFRDFSIRQFNIREVQLPVDLRSHAFEPRFPHERIVFRRTFDKRRETVFLGCPRLCPQILGAQILSRNFLLNSHQAVAAVADCFCIYLFIQRVVSRIV